MRKFVLFALFMAAAGTLGFADTRVDETIDVGDLGVSVQAISGSIDVVGVGGSTLRVSGTIGDDVDRLIVEREGSKIVVRPDIPDEGRRRGRRNHDVSVDLQIELPRGTDLDVAAVSADITLSDLDGSVNVESVSGTIELDGAFEELELQSVSGTIRVDGDADLRHAEFDTVSGNIDIGVAIAPDARLDINTLSGSVRLRLDGATDARFDINTFSGDVSNAFGPGLQRKRGSGGSLEFSLGSGSARISINTFSGNVELAEN